MIVVKDERSCTSFGVEKIWYFEVEVMDRDKNITIFEDMSTIHGMRDIVGV